MGVAASSVEAADALRRAVDGAGQRLGISFPAATCAFNTQVDYFDPACGKTVSCLQCSNGAGAARVERGAHVVRQSQHPNVPHFVGAARWNGKQASLTVIPPIQPLVAGATGGGKGAGAAGAAAECGHSFLLLQLHVAEIVFGIAGVLDAVVALSQRAQFDSLHPSQIFVAAFPHGATNVGPETVLAGRWLLADLSTTSERDERSDVATNRAVALLVLQLLIGVLANPRQRSQLLALCRSDHGDAFDAFLRDLADVGTSTPPSTADATAPPPSSSSTPLNCDESGAREGADATAGDNVAADDGGRAAAPGVDDEALPGSSGDPSRSRVAPVASVAPPTLAVHKQTPAQQVLSWLLRALRGVPECAAAELRQLLLVDLDVPLCRALDLGARLHSFSDAPRDSGRDPATLTEAYGEIGRCVAAMLWPRPGRREDSVAERRRGSSTSGEGEDEAGSSSSSSSPESAENAEAQLLLLKRRVLPWLLQPMHVAQPAAGALFNLLIGAPESDDRAGADAPETRGGGGVLLQRASRDAGVAALLQQWSARCADCAALSVRSGFVRFIPALLRGCCGVSPATLCAPLAHCYAFVCFELRCAVLCRSTTASGSLSHALADAATDAARWYLRTLPAVVRSVCALTHATAVPHLDPAAAASFLNDVLLRELVLLLRALVCCYPSHAQLAAPAEAVVGNVPSRLLMLIAAALTAAVSLWDVAPPGVVNRAPLLEVIAHCLFNGAVETRELAINLLLGLIGSGAPAIGAPDLRRWWLPLLAPLCADRDRRLRQGACDIVLKILTTVQAAALPLPPECSPLERPGTSFVAPLSLHDTEGDVLSLIEPFATAADDELRAAQTELTTAAAATCSSAQNPCPAAFAARHAATYRALWELWNRTPESDHGACVGIVPTKDFLAGHLRAANGSDHCIFNGLRVGCSAAGLLLPQPLH